MRIIFSVLGFIIVFLTFSCYAEITGTVVDAETGKPIEGAVVLVEWAKTRGLPGMTYHETYKVFEALTDKEGRITISGVFDPLVDPPDITIYKEGYVTWNNKSIFPDYRKRSDFKLRNNYVFELEKFKQEYTYDAHTEFIHGAMGTGAIEKKKLMMKAIEWEEGKAFQERGAKKSK
jgi:hypothetical protein